MDLNVYDKVVAMETFQKLQLENILSSSKICID